MHIISSKIITPFGYGLLFTNFVNLNWYSLGNTPKHWFNGILISQKLVKYIH